MKKNKLTLTFLFSLLISFSACTGAKKSEEALSNSTTHKKVALEIISGGKVCTDILTLDKKYSGLYKIKPEDITKNPAALTKAKEMLSDMQKLANENPKFSCILAQEGEQFVYDREKYVAVLTGLKKQFDTKKSM
jgi:hypothetical protein